MPNDINAETASAVEFDSSVLQQIRRHARSSMAAEICGVLIGNVADGVTTVAACIEGESAREAGTHVTFTQQTWEHIYKVKDAKFPDSAVVGWYHSHPGFGIFLSDYDLFIHRNFFAAPHQIAWVFDPHSDEEGCFGWLGGEVVALTRFSVRRRPASALSPSPPVIGTARTEPAAIVPDKHFHMARLRKIAILGACTVMLGCLSVWQLSRAIQRRRSAAAQHATHSSPASAALPAHTPNGVVERKLTQKHLTITDPHSAAFKQIKDAIDRSHPRDEFVAADIDFLGERISPPSATDKNGSDISRITYHVTYHWAGGDDRPTECDYMFNVQTRNVEGTSIGPASPVNGVDWSQVGQVVANLLLKEK